MKKRWLAAWLAALLLVQVCAAPGFADGAGTEQSAEDGEQSIEEKVSILLSKGEKDAGTDDPAESPAPDAGEAAPAALEDKLSDLLAAKGGQQAQAAETAEELFDPLWYTKCTYYLDVDNDQLRAVDGADGVITAWEMYGTAPLAQFRGSVYKPDGNGAYVYEDIASEWAADDGDYELYYYPEDGSIAIVRNGVRTAYAPLQRHGEEYDLPADFDSCWFEQSGTFYFNMLDNVSFSRYSSGSFVAEFGMSDMIGFEVDAYEAAAFGGVYYSGSGGELYYYPDRPFVLLAWDDGIFFEFDLQMDVDPGSSYDYYESGPSFDPLVYFIENSDLMYFGWEDIEGFDSDMCTLAINGVYARSCRAFQMQKFQDYFSQFDWYQPIIAPEYFSDDMLNEYQIANIALLLEYKEYMGY